MVGWYGMEFTQALIEELLQRLQACLFFMIMKTMARLIALHGWCRWKCYSVCRRACRLGAFARSMAKFDDARVGSCAGEHSSAGTRAPGAC